VRTSRYAGRRAIAGVLAGGAILGAATACASSSSPAASVASATAGTTAPARTPGDPLAALSGGQIITRVVADLKVVSSVHVAGSLESSGQHVALNLTLGTRGKYVKTSAQDSRLAPLRALYSPGTFARLLDGDPAGESKGTVTIIAGQPALPVKDADGRARIYVTVAAHPEFLRIDSSSGRLDFTRYNARLHLTPPPASQVLDGAKYGF
jgi:hypothetical protein